MADSTSIMPIVSLDTSQLNQLNPLLNQFDQLDPLLESQSTQSKVSLPLNPVFQWLDSTETCLLNSLYNEVDRGKRSDNGFKRKRE